MIHQKALYLTIVSRICDKIIQHDFEDDHVFSEAIYGFEFGVRQHIISKVFEKLVEIGALEKKGATCFLSEKAEIFALKYRQEEVLNDDLETSFSLLQMLKITPNQLHEAYQQYLEKNS